MGTFNNDNKAGFPAFSWRAVDNFSVQTQQDGMAPRCGVLCSILLPSQGFAHVQVELAFSPFPRRLSAVKNEQRTVSVREHSLQIRERSFNQSVSVSRRVNLPNALERHGKHIKSLFGGQGV